MAEKPQKNDGGLVCYSGRGRGPCACCACHKIFKHDKNEHVYNKTNLPAAEDKNETTIKIYTDDNKTQTADKGMSDKTFPKLCLNVTCPRGRHISHYALKNISLKGENVMRICDHCRATHYPTCRICQDILNKIAAMLKGQNISEENSEWWLKEVQKLIDIDTKSGPREESFDVSPLRKHHSLESLFSTVSNISAITEQKATTFKYVFPKQTKKTMVSPKVSSTELIKDLRDKLFMQTEAKKPIILRSEKTMRMYEQEIGIEDKEGEKKRRELKDETKEKEKKQGKDEMTPRQKHGKTKLSKELKTGKRSQKDKSNKLKDTKGSKMFESLKPKSRKQELSAQSQKGKHKKQSKTNKEQLSKPKTEKHSRLENKYFQENKGKKNDNRKEIRSRDEAARDGKDTKDTKSKDKAARDGKDTKDTESKDKAARDGKDIKDKESKDKTARDGKVSKDKESKDKAARDGKDTKDTKSKDKAARDGKDTKDTESKDKAARDGKDTKDTESKDKPAKDGKDTKDTESKDKAARDGKDIKDKESKDKTARDGKISKDKESKDKAARDGKDTKDTKSKDKAARDGKDTKDKKSKDKAARDGKDTKEKDNTEEKTSTQKPYEAKEDKSKEDKQKEVKSKPSDFRHIKRKQKNDKDDENIDYAQIQEREIKHREILKLLLKGKEADRDHSRRKKHESNMNAVTENKKTEGHGTGKRMTSKNAHDVLEEDKNMRKAKNLALQKATMEMERLRRGDMSKNFLFTVISKTTEDKVGNQGIGNRKKITQRKVITQTASLTNAVHELLDNTKKEGRCVYNRNSINSIVLDSELEYNIEDLCLEMHNRKKRKYEMVDIIKGNDILKLPAVREEVEELKPVSEVPLLFKSTPEETLIVEDIFKAKKELFSTVNSVQDLSGVIHYELSDRTFIDKGWTLLPTEKVVRKMNVYRMRPAHPELDWFERNRNKGILYHDTGEKLAEFDDEGRGRWYYKNGRLALEYYNAQEPNVQQRLVVHSNGEPDVRGRSQPITVLAMFDYLGNGIVFDHGGKIRMKYDQNEGVVLDRGIGPMSRWKWHSLNDPPVLQQVMIDNKMPRKDPEIAQLGSVPDDVHRDVDERMLAIEFDNFLKSKQNKVRQGFKPFQIKMKALKINEHFSLKVLDQETVYLRFRDGKTNLKLNLGMLLDHREIIDTDTSDVGDVLNALEQLPTRTDSLGKLQHYIEHAKRYEKARTEREQHLRPQLTASVDQFDDLLSKPLKAPLRTLPGNTAASAYDLCQCRKPPLDHVSLNTLLM